jgi:dihydrofolate synthase/folylpolyglutamate synthase
VSDFTEGKTHPTLKDVMTFTTEADAVTFIFRSLRKLRGVERGYDEDTRDVTPTLHLIAAHNLLATPREYAVVTGSKGKGSTTVITAKLLQHLGHTAGMITSPHLVSWRERIRVNGRAIPEPEFLRIVNDVAPEIEALETALPENKYFSPQGIFLTVALRWFDEQKVNAAVLEVGRGGRFDDIAVVPNRLSIFTPIMLEHPQYLGPTLERIAWHKAGIIKPSSYAYSVPQAPEVLDVLQAEAAAKGAQFAWIAPADMGQYLGSSDKGIHMALGRYGEVTLSLLGRYQVANATLAVTAAGNMHGRLPGVSHGDPEYMERIRAGLANVTWPGRCQKLQDHPAVYLDGAINSESAQAYVESVREWLTRPVVSILGVPDDKDVGGVYQALGAISDEVILTESRRNLKLHFPPAEKALDMARQYNTNVSHAPTLADAVEQALLRAGKDGTILIAGTQSVVADAIEHWGLTYEVI